MAEIRERAAQRRYDAVVVGAGPNGLAAAIELARAGRSVLVVEAAPTVGGGTRSAELTLPGFVHDVCSAIHPLGMASPFFQGLPLADHGLQWIQPPVALAHPFDDGSAVMLHRSIDETAALLGWDGRAYRALMGPMAASWNMLGGEILRPLRLPRHPLALINFGVRAIWPARLLAEGVFRDERARGFFAGLAAHAIMPLERLPSAAFGIMLGTMGHVVGWPLPRGGAQTIADAMASYLRSLGGEILTDARVDALDDLPPAHDVVCDVTPRQLLRIAGERLPDGYRRALGRYRYGPGVFKIDWALDGPIPWTAPECAQAGTVHLGATLPEIAASEWAMWRGSHHDRPFVLLAQQSLFDSSRAPEGKHTVWAYCHVPHGSTCDMTEDIEAQIDRFAPGFRDRILARNVMGPAAMERYNANYVGGDINGGVQDLFQHFTRPVARIIPYATPVPGLFLCSSSTPPGGGVHGLCGYFAARAVLQVRHRTP
ncbi:MAG TPA: NAD(P)/FAD-dependent oxidoreductase [Herpetosiphonaceae bacterium]|nr:NAD(P)/FAD-dependent oxidoreductase [Herpetosiphonaceae bacterium]